MGEFLGRLFRVEQGEWPKLIQFGMFGFLLQMGMGVGFSAGDAAFLSNVGADSLPLVFMLTPLVMLFYTIIYSYLLVRFGIDHVVDITLAALLAGGAALWALIDSGLPPEWETTLYFGLKLYLAMWYIALYSLFWNYTDAYFDIQDAKRLFPLFAAFCALGTAFGALIVSLSAEFVPMQYFFMLWAVIAFATAPLARLLRRRWRQIAENDAEFDEEQTGALGQLAAVGKAFGKSRYTIVFTATLFVTLLMTNLAEFQYSKVLQEGRTEGELASLFGTLYAVTNVFNLFICLFVFNRLVARFGVRNVAFVQPLAYFIVFGYFFLQGGTVAAIAAFFAYHGVLTSIEYNNENLLFNAVPSKVKRPLRTVVEGMAEPLASLVAGGFLLYAANHVDMRELSGIGLIIGAVLIAIVVALRQLYPAAMASNMRQGWMNFGDRKLTEPEFAPEAENLLETEAAKDSREAEIARFLLKKDLDTASEGAHAPQEVDDLLARLCGNDPKAREGAAQALAEAASREDIHLVAPLARRLPDLPREERRQIIGLLGRVCDSESIPDILAATAELAPRERRAMSAMLAAIGETAIPRLIGGLRQRSLPYSTRSVAARALAELSYAQFASQLDRLVQDELSDARHLLSSARRLDQEGGHASLGLLARAQRERVGASVDFVLELLAIGGFLPNFDLLIVSLHSANPKVRGNAIETIESGIDNALFRLLEPLLHTQEADDAETVSAANFAIADILDAALESGQPIEMAAAADVLHATLDKTEFASKIQPLMSPHMPQLLRGHLLALLGFGNPEGLRSLDVLAALGGDPDYGTATLESLLALAESAETAPPADTAIGGTANGIAFWIARSTLDEVAGRFPALALVMLKCQDDRQYAA